MLVLSRRSGESVVIDDRIQVIVQRISRRQIRLLIDAPDDVAVDRAEVWVAKHGALEDAGPEQKTGPEHGAGAKRVAGSEEKAGSGLQPLSF